MDNWIVQLVATPIIATATTLFVGNRQQRERISCFVDWRYTSTRHGYIEKPYLGVHNRSTQPIAIHRVQLLRSGFAWLAPIEGTALHYEDPADLSFPYVVKPGEIQVLILDEEQIGRVAAWAGTWRKRIYAVFGFARVMVECRTTAKTVLRVSAEEGLPWDTRLGWARK